MPTKAMLTKEMSSRDTLLGGYFATTAYLIWGITPVYFKWLEHISPWEILGHRTVWALLLLLGILAFRRQLGALRLAPSKIFVLILTALLLTVNWLVFIYAVVNDQILETSLGYFICPLVSVLLGVAVLKESLRPLQWLAVGIMSGAILVSLVIFGTVPWLALTLALSFSLYSLFRKKMALPPVAGTALEIMIMAPAGLILLLVLHQSNELVFSRVDLTTDLLLMMSSVVTVLPLLCFAAAVTRLPLSIHGMFQYLAPSLSLLIGLFIYDEPFGLDRQIIFFSIWVALLIITLEAWRYHSQLNFLKKRNLPGA